MLQIIERSRRRHALILNAEVGHVVQVLERRGLDLLELVQQIPDSELRDGLEILRLVARVLARGVVVAHVLHPSGDFVHLVVLEDSQLLVVHVLRRVFDFQRNKRVVDRLVLLSL